MRKKRLWKHSIQRRCYSMHECCICGMCISRGQDYWDRGAWRKAHILCGIKADSSQSADAQPTHESEREDERFEAAEKVAWKSYDGPVWDGGDYYSSAEAYADDHEDIQRYVWAVKTRDLKLDARDVIESALEAQGFTSEAENWIVDESGLQRMLDQWAGKLPIEAWVVDYSRAVLLDGIVEELWPDG